MASVCNGDSVDSFYTGDSASGRVMDERELTLSSKNFVPPTFSPVRRPSSTLDRIKRRRKKVTTSTPQLKAVQSPLEAPELHELDLESTLKASGSAPSDFKTRSSGVGSPGGGGLSSSYMRAVTEGRVLPSSSTTVESASLLRKKNKSKKKHRESVLGQYHSSSNPSISSSMFDESSYKNISSAKLLRRELMDLEQLGEVEKTVDSTDVLFSVMEHSYKKERKRPKVLAALLIYGNVDINARAPSGMTALHYAVQDCDMESLKVLTAFGANINATNQFGETALEMLNLNESEDDTGKNSGGASAFSSIGTLHQTMRRRWQSMWDGKAAQRLKCLEFLRSMNAMGHQLAQRMASVPCVPAFPLVPSSASRGSSWPSPSHNKKYEEALYWEKTVTAKFSELEQSIRGRLDNTTKAGSQALFSHDDAVSLALQLQEMRLFQRSGSRILCLDGGGMRGLVQLEILSQLEKRTGRKITELFDWIIGTSTGAIIALGLVYAKKSLSQLRQLYFKMKDEVFGKTKGAGMSFNTAGLEKIFKREFTEHMCMDDVTYPRVLISAVKKEHINLKLHFFNNCFNDDLCRHVPVWKVARYTSATPVLFGEADEYVDGGLLANNPSDSGMTRIQSHFRSRGEKLPISLVVSVGTGKYPARTLGSVDFLFVGGQGWSSPFGTSNLMELLSFALVEPSVADKNCRCRCEQESIHYFRLNARLDQVVASGETDTETLVNMILQTRKEMEERAVLDKLVPCFHDLAAISNRCHAHSNGENYSSDSSANSQ